jgi:hypothetical protein
MAFIVYNIGALRVAFYVIQHYDQLTDFGQKALFWCQFQETYARG